jgi:DNA-binding NarL/FixJ family response regulator
MRVITVLCVDRDPLFAAAIQAAATDIKSTTTFVWAKCNVSGIVAANRTRPDLIFVDQSMIEALSRGLTRSAWTRGILPKIVILANFAHFGQLSEARLDCADAYVCRDELPHMLPALINELCGTRPAHEKSTAVDQIITANPIEEFASAGE